MALDWLKGVLQDKDLLNFGAGVVDQFAKTNKGNDYQTQLKNALQTDYDSQKSLHDYTNQYNQELAGYNASQAAAANAAAGARASAARATEANRQAAAKKANKGMMRTYDDVMTEFQPYRDSAARILPSMEKAYAGGLQGLEQVSAQVLSPEMMARLKGASPAVSYNIPINSMFRGA